jgi:adenosylmethionine-8-amino-7-oxononanoate aminotransferase
MTTLSGADDGWESRALEHLWYCCAQMKDYEVFPPLHVREASGSHIILADGTKLIDAISSWWCKTLGHAHPRLTAALCDHAHRAVNVESSVLDDLTRITIDAIRAALN